MKKKKLIIVTSVLLILVFVGTAFPGCREKVENSEYVSFSMPIGEDGSFRILQLTDIHFINSDVEVNRNLAKSYRYRDGWAKTAITELVNRTKPDLIIATGDSIFTLDTMLYFTGTNDNEAAFHEVAKFLDSFEIPWAFLFGNHDEEGSLLNSNQQDGEATKRELSAYLNSDEIKYCLYSDGPEDITGVGNYIINVVNKDGTTNTPLVLFDSGSYLRGIIDPEDGESYSNQHKYEWVHDDQLNWYEKAIKDISRIAGRLVESIVFQHIPMPVYRDVINAAVETLGANWQDTINANWTYGKQLKLNTSIGEIIYHGGICNEPDHEVCCSFVGDFHGHSFDGGHEFERLLSVGSTKYVFCGHDHRNTFSFTYKGIRLSYGMSIDYSANGIVPVDNQDIYDEVEQRGGTLITIKGDRSVSVDQVPFTRNLYRETLEELHLPK